jgi:hypothetical protein
MGFYYNFDSCFQWYGEAKTYVLNFMFVSFYEFSIISEYDEMNCNLIFEVFLQCTLMYRFCLYEITMNLNLMNDNVKYVEKQGINNECTHMKCK